MNKALQEFLRSYTLALKPSGWRAFIGHADRDGLNRSLLEIQCAWDRPLLARDIHVGTPQERLDEIPISLTLVPVDEDYFKREDKPEQHGSEVRNGEQQTPVVGKLTYHAPINTADGVVNDKAGSVTGWFILGKENYSDAWRRLSMIPSPDFSIGITALFKDENCTWDGTTPLDITEGKLVFRGAPTVLKKEEFLEDGPSDSEVIISKTLPEIFKHIKRLNYHISWILWVLVLIIIEMWFRR